MNNKKRGDEFEDEICGMLAKEGWWVHFIQPDETGSQPFDVIAVRDGDAIAIDCKTCSQKYFSILRLEENQKLAFELWLRRGNTMPQIAVKYNDEVYFVPYHHIKKVVKIDVTAYPKKLKVWKVMYDSEYDCQ